MGYVDFYAKIYPILYPPLENSTTCITIDPEPLEKYDTTPKINANNLSKKAQDIFKESLGMSSTYKSPKVQITSKKLISTDQVSTSFSAASQSFDVQTDSTSNKEIFENNEKKENNSVSSSPALRLKIKLTSQIGESQDPNSSSKTIKMASESSTSQSRRKVRKSKGTKRNRMPFGTTSKVFEGKCPPGPSGFAGPATSSNSVKSSTSSKDKSDFKTLFRTMQALHKRKHLESER